MPKHAYLSASASHRWLACPPSAKLCAGINDSGSPYAQQGTDAHALCEYKVEKLLGRNPEDPIENLTWFDTEMDDCTDQYAAYVAEQIEEAKTHCSDPLILIEEKLDFSKWVPEGFGTGDCVIIADDVLHIIDFKYGLGVLVDAEENPQMMCYALGALNTYEYLYSIQTIRMTIFQPRRDNISTYEISRDNLMKWADEILKPTAALAYNGEGEFNAGDHCQFKEYALQQALSGVEYPGFKVVEGKSNRKYSDENAVASTVEAAGFDPYEKKLLGITAMTSLLGKKKFNELLSGFITKPQGKPTLVPESDKRPALNTAKDDFSEE